jgi:hypothetical protein
VALSNDGASGFILSNANDAAGLMTFTERPRVAAAKSVLFSTPERGAIAVEGNVAWVADGLEVVRIDFTSDTVVRFTIASPSTQARITGLAQKSGRLFVVVDPQDSVGRNSVLQTSLLDAATGAVLARRDLTVDSGTFNEVALNDGGAAAVINSAAPSRDGVFVVTGISSFANATAEVWFMTADTDLVPGAVTLVVKGRTFGGVEAFVPDTLAVSDSFSRVYFSSRAGFGLARTETFCGIP